MKKREKKKKERGKKGRERENLRYMDKGAKKGKLNWGWKGSTVAEYNIGAPKYK